MDNITSAWSINEKEFFELKSTEDKIKFFIRYAVLAPSGHNTQPWLFKLESENSLNLYADRTRALPVIDSDDRELTISCGAALTNLIISANYFGYSAEVKILPDKNDFDLLAKVTFNLSSEQRSDIKKYFDSILKRHTNRKPFKDKMIDGQILQKLCRIASEEKVNLRIISNHIEREELMTIIEQGDMEQANDKSFCRELALWVHPERKKSLDGIPVYAYGNEDRITTSGPFFIGNLEWGKIQAGRDRNMFNGSPVIAILESKSNTSEDWLKTGIALEMMLLYATSEKISASYLNQPLEVKNLIQKIRESLNMSGYPQQIIRLGYGQDVKPTPRRNVNDVIR